MNRVTRFRPCPYCGRSGGPACGGSADERRAHRPIRRTAQQWADLDAFARVMARLGKALRP